MILIAGATSQPGQKLIPMLVEQGYEVRVLARDPSKLEDALSLGVEIVEGDLRQPDTLLRVCKGAEAVVSLATAIGGAGENNFHTVDEVGNRSLMESAQKSGVKRFVFISACGADRAHPVDFFRMKYEAEEYLKSLNMEYTVLRPTAFMESWCARIGTQVLADEWVTIYGDGKNPINFISAEDVAKFILLALDDPRLRNQILTIGGPQNLTFEEVVATYEWLSHKIAHKIYTPAWQLQWMRAWYGLFDETKSRFMGIRHELATSDWRVDMNEMMMRYPIVLSCLEDIVRKTMGLNG